MISAAVLRAKQTGALNLGQRELREFPRELLHVDELRFENARWWEFVTITKFDINFNEIQSIPDGVFEANLLDLTNISFTHNKLLRVPTSVGALTQLKQLNLANNHLADLGNVDFGNLGNLVELRLSNNNLTSVPGGITKLGSLQALYWDGNAITEVRLSFPDSLRILDFSGNKISTISESFASRGSELKNLNLSKNTLVSIPACVGFLRKLTALDVSQNLVETLPELSDLHSLDSFTASHNKLKNVSGEFTKSVSLLALDNNRLSQFPEGLKKLTNLVTLDLRNNDIKRIDPEFARDRKTLLRFYLDGNPLREIPFAVIKTGAVAILDHLRKKLEDENETHSNAACPGSKKNTAPENPKEITELVVMNNREFVRFPDLGPQLRAVLVKNCPVTNLPLHMTDGCLGLLSKVEISRAAISDIPRLKLPALVTFHVSGCVVHEVDLGNFAECPKLQEIKLPLNRMTRFTVPSSAQLMASLRVLDLEDNQLENVAADLMVACPGLQQLMLMNNCIRNIPAQFGSWLSLRSLSVSGNPLKSIPQSTILKGTEAIKKLLKERLAN